MAPTEWARIEGTVDINAIGLDDFEIVPCLDGPQWMLDAIDAASEGEAAREWALKKLADRDPKADKDDADYHQQGDDALTQRHRTGR